MTSKLASGSGRRRSGTRKRPKTCRPHRSPGRASSSSATPAETSRAARGTCTRSTPRPARSCGNSSSCPRPRAISFAGLWAPHRSTIRLGKTCLALRSAAGEPGLLRPWTRLLGSCMCPLAIPRPTTTTVCARGTISSRVPSSSSTPGPALTRTISSLWPGTGTTGTSPTRRL
jgi:hypothetical protein